MCDLLFRIKAGAIRNVGVPAEALALNGLAIDMYREPKSLTLRESRSLGLGQSNTRRDTESTIQRARSGRIQLAADYCTVARLAQLCVSNT